MENDHYYLQFIHLQLTIEGAKLSIFHESKKQIPAFIRKRGC